MSSFYAVLTNKSNDIQENTLLNDIETHLSQLLNARQYMISTTEDYGLPDICADYTSNYSSRVIDATRDLIQQFEPRLRVHEISCNDKERVNNQLLLRVIASIDEHALVEFQAKIGAQAHSSVRAA